jgi:hypothetical protein
MSKLRDESLDNLGHDACNKLQGKNNHQPFDGFATISERYERMDLRIHMHVRVGLSEFCAIFQYAETESAERVRTFPPITSEPTNRSSTSNLDNPLLVRIIDLFKPKKGLLRLRHLVKSMIVSKGLRLRLYGCNPSMSA